jgi:hypothetical protein
VTATPSQLLATLAADLLDLLAGADIDNVKRCAPQLHPPVRRCIASQEPALVWDGHLRQ